MHKKVFYNALKYLLEYLFFFKCIYMALIYMCVCVCMFCFKFRVISHSEKFVSSSNIALKKLSLLYLNIIFFTNKMDFWMATNLDSSSV